MTKDFAKKGREPGGNSRNTRNSRNSNNRKQVTQPSKVPGWVWLFTGAVLGAFIMFLMYLSGLAPQSPQTTANSPSKKAGEESSKDIPKPRFDFYKMLKESEVAVTTPSSTANANKPKKALPSKEYILQAGSFRSADDADLLRAELIMMNLDAYVETSKIRDGEVWHRVLAGPYDNRSKMAKARSILVSNDIPPLLLTRAKSN